MSADILQSTVAMHIIPGIVTNNYCTMHGEIPVANWVNAKWNFEMGIWARIFARLDFGELDRCRALPIGRQSIRIWPESRSLRSLRSLWLLNAIITCQLDRARTVQRVQGYSHLGNGNSAKPFNLAFDFLNYFQKFCMFFVIAQSCFSWLLKLTSLTKL